jgi:protein gp37
MAPRLGGRFGYPKENPFAPTIHRHRIKDPYKWRKMNRVFVSSMGDLFHDDIQDGYITWIFWVMARTRQQYMLLTKRPDRMLDFLTKWGDRFEPDGDYEPKMVRGPDAIREAHKAKRAHLFADMLEMWGDPPEGSAYPTYDWMDGMITYPDVLQNVALGVSVENQSTYNERASILLRCPAEVRFISAEPLLGDIDFQFPVKVPGTEARCKWIGPRIDQVIVGGESGSRARPMHPDWVRSARDQCEAAYVPFFFKGWGTWQNGSDFDHNPNRNHIVLTDGTHGRTPEEMGYNTARGVEWNQKNPTSMAKVGKKHSGRTLDGRQWGELPRKGLFPIWKMVNSH